MALNFNFKDVTAMDALPAGNYKVRVDEAELKYGNESGNPYIAVTLLVEGGEFDGRKLFKNMSLTEKSLWSVKRDLSALGVNMDRSIDFEDPRELQGLIGARGQAVVIQKEYEGEKRNEVKKLIAQTNGDAAVSTASKKRKF